MLPDSDQMVSIQVEMPFKIVLADSKMVSFDRGPNSVPPEIADHWYTKLHTGEAGRDLWERKCQAESAALRSIAYLRGSRSQRDRRWRWLAYIGAHGDQLYLLHQLSESFQKSTSPIEAKATLAAARRVWLRIDNKRTAKAIAQAERQAEVARRAESYAKGVADRRRRIGWMEDLGFTGVDAEEQVADERRRMFKRAITNGATISEVARKAGLTRARVGQIIAQDSHRRIRPPPLQRFCAVDPVSLMTPLERGMLKRFFGEHAAMAGVKQPRETEVIGVGRPDDDFEALLLGVRNALKIAQRLAEAATTAASRGPIPAAPAPVAESPESPIDRYVDEGKAAEFLSLSRSYIRKIRLTGGGPPYAKLGGAVRYRVSELITWAEAKTVKSTSDHAARMDR